jgi:succinylglutamate desuccinylase
MADLADDGGSINAIKVVPGDHLIAAFFGTPSGPTLIVVGGLHGNETGGVVALSNVARKLRPIENQLQGRVYFLAGNTRALARGVRYIDADLNRSWTAKNLSSAATSGFRSTAEGSELSELSELIDSILITARDEVYVLDLHSTSAEGTPFATVGDTMRNRHFAQRFPVSIILGIEEQLDGTMLEYLNNAGAITLGFEGGQHYSPGTVANHEKLVWNALFIANILTPADKFREDRGSVHGSKGKGKIFEIRYRHTIRDSDEFEMDPGFDNFDPIVRGQPLARDRTGIVRAPESGLLLMPLYQKLGEDGFFIGRRVAPFWLALSAILRRLGVQNIMSMLPGVRRDPNDPDRLIINTQVARLFPLQVFHLLGFRRRRWKGKKLIVSRRKHDMASPFVTRGKS